MANLNFVTQLTHVLNNTFLNRKLIFTCVSVRCNDDENSALSATLKYCLSLNFFSRANNCCVVKGVLGFRLGLCFLRLHLILAGSPFSGSGKKRNTFSVEVHVVHGNSDEHYARMNKLTDTDTSSREKVFRVG